MRFLRRRARANTPPEDAVAQAAARWVAAKDRGLAACESQALLEWLAADPRHAAEYGRILRSWRGLDDLAAVPKMAALGEAIERRARARSWHRWALATGGLTAAAAIAGAFLIGAHYRLGPPPASAPPPRDYVVLPSTAHSRTLEDGTVAELNGDSLIETEFLPDERRVRLVRGEANFHVAKNARRPFIVSAGPVTVRAVGTAFNVRLSPGQVEVLVTEGKVRLGQVAAGGPPGKGAALGTAAGSVDRSLVADERAVVATAGPSTAWVTVDKPNRAEFEAALAWKCTRLVFDHTPFNEVVAAFNLYNTHKLVLSDPSLRERTLTGIFRTDNLAGFIRLLPASADVIAEAGAEGETLLRAAPERSE